MAGRPSDIDKVVAHRTQRADDGTSSTRPVTAGEQIVDFLRAGNYLEPSIASAGVGRETVYGWLREAARLRTRAAVQNIDVADLPAAELGRYGAQYVAFSDAVVQARSEWEVASNTTLERAGRGGVTSVVTTEKRDAQGNLIESTTRTETHPPNPAVIMWRLTRAFPHRYSQKIEVADVGEFAEATEDTAARIADEIEAQLAAEAAAAPKRRRRK